MEKITAKMARLKSMGTKTKIINEFDVVDWMENDKSHCSRLSKIYFDIEIKAIYGEGKIEYPIKYFYNSIFDYTRKLVWEYIEKKFTNEGFDVSINNDNLIKISWENAEEGKALQYKLTMLLKKEKINNNYKKKIDLLLQNIYFDIDSDNIYEPDKTYNEFVIAKCIIDEYYPEVWNEIKDGVISELKNDGYIVTENIDEYNNTVLNISWAE